jgi:hypothetical protein
MTTLLSIYSLDSLDDAVEVILYSFVVIYGINYFVYIPYYTIDKPEKYFKKIGFTEAAIEYQFSRKLFLIAIALSISFFVFVILIIFLEIAVYRIPPLPSSLESLKLPHFFIVFILLEFMLVSITAVAILGIRFTLQLARKDFNFYLAKVYFKVGSQQEDIVGKIRYLILTIDTYNKFLERNLKLKINNIKDIYSRIVSASTEEKIMIGESIGKALEKDKLELAGQLRELFSSPDKEEQQKFLTKESLILNQQFKELLTAIIPAVITAIVAPIIGSMLGLPLGN